MDNPNYVSQKLYDDLQNMTAKSEEYQKKINEYSDLETWIEAAKKQKEVKTQVEIGTGVYMKAKISPKDLILLEVGHGFFPEVTMEEAGPIIKKRKKFFQDKIDRLMEEIIKLRANITRFETALNDLIVEKSFGG